MTGRRHPQTFIFDLDNTLYEDSTQFFEHVKLRMNEYISELLNVSEEHAAFLRDHYFREHGTTLNGLLQHYHINAQSFMDHIDDVPLENLQADEELGELINALPGNKYILTNASDFHTHRLLRHLKLNGLFDGIYTIQSARFTPKPYRHYFENFLRQYQVDPRTGIFFEDSAHNLLPAAQLGMRTILINTDCPRARSYHNHPDVHEIIDSLKHHLKRYCP